MSRKDEKTPTPPGDGEVPEPTPGGGACRPELEKPAEDALLDGSTSPVAPTGPGGSGTDPAAAGGPDAAADRAIPPPAAAQAATAEEAWSVAALYLDQLQRLQAEFDNYRKRVRREQEDWFRQAKVELVSLFLPVLDDLRRARDHAGPEGPPDAAGLQLILRRFEDALNKAGLEEQKTEPGAAFDPEMHEALFVVPSAEQPEGAIVQVIEPGYLFQGKIVRRGKVACSSGREPE